MHPDGGLPRSNTMSVGVSRLRYAPLGVGVPQGGGDSAGFVALKDGDQLVVDHGPLRGRRYLQVVPATPVKAVTGATTLAVEDSGKVIALNSTTSRLIDLPKASLCKGCEFQFHYMALVASGTGHRIVPFAGDYIGGGITALTVVANDDLLLCIDGDAVGDRFTLRSNGTNGWTITATRGGDLEKI